MILLIFTSSYPYDSQHEDTFLEPEIPYMLSGFDKVILVPKMRKGKRAPVPAEVEVDESYARALETVKAVSVLWKALSTTCFYRDLLSNPTIWTKPSAIRRLFTHVGRARITQEWVEEWLAHTGSDGSDCMFYTFWFDAATLGIGLAKRQHPHVKVVSRAHGYDIYADRYPVPYLPCRLQSLACTDGVFPDSAAGANHLLSSYPDYRPIIEPALMGLPDPGFLTKPSTDGVFRIMSCAIIRPVKRIELLLEGIAEAARQRPGMRFEWHHIGNSEVEGVRESLQAYADEYLPTNARAFLPGYNGQQALYAFYRENPVDVFVNVSVSEGTPVSAIEAASCGVPIIATAVGGNQEIVTTESGFLLDSNPTAQEIARSILMIADHPEAMGARRSASRAVWNEKYNARRNYESFVERLKAVRESR